MLWKCGLGDKATLVYLQIPPIHKSQFKKHSRDLLLYFSQHLSDYFELDILKYKDIYTITLILNVSIFQKHLRLRLNATDTNIIFWITLARTILS